MIGQSDRAKEAVDAGATAQPGRERWGLAIEAAFILVVVVHVAAAALVYRSQHRGDQLAEDTIAVAQRFQIDRVMWPAVLRGSVPKLLAAGITPVLNESPRVPAQELAVNNTPLLVTERGGHLDGLTTHNERSGTYNLRLIDIQSAGARPLQAGESIVKEIARPYIFSPLDESPKIRRTDPLRLPFTLSGGSYRFSIDIMDTNQLTSLTIGVKGGAVESLSARKLGVIVFQPTVASIRVDANDDPDRANVEITVGFEIRPGKETGKKGPDVRFHRWSLERVD